MRDVYKAWRKMTKSLGSIEILAAISEKYYKEIHNRNPPKPKTKSKYIGIEIECFSKLDDNEVLQWMLYYDLEKHMNIGDDGSVEGGGSSNSYEFRVLSTEKELPTVLKKLDKFLKKGKFKVNNTCGLHVHLDMRNRNVNECYQKLMKFQDLLYGMVSPKRWDNDYCAYSTDERPQRRMSAINYTAYAEHRTLEVRLHQGSVNVKQIENWVNLLLKVIATKSDERVYSRNNAIAWAGKDTKIRKFIDNSFNARWFSMKSRIISSQYARLGNG